MKLSIYAIATGLAFSISNQQLFAAELNPTVNEDFSFSFGGANLKGDTAIGSTLDGNTETEINLDILGIGGEEQSNYIRGHYQYAKNWRLDVEQYGLKQSATAIVAGEIIFNDTTYGLGAALHAEFNLDIFAVSTSYLFVKDEEKQVGLGFGLHITEITALLAGAGLVNGVPEAFIEKKATTTAPLPSIRLFGSYAFNSQLATELNFGYFGLDVDKYSGNFLSSTAVLEWRPHKNFGIGGGYTFFDINLKVNEPNSNSVFKTQLRGPLIYLVGGF